MPRCRKMLSASGVTGALPISATARAPTSAATVPVTICSSAAGTRTSHCSCQKSFADTHSPCRKPSTESSTSRWSIRSSGSMPRMFTTAPLRSSTPTRRAPAAHSATAVLRPTLPKPATEKVICDGSMPMSGSISRSTSTNPYAPACSRPMMPPASAGLPVATRCASARDADAPPCA